MRAVEPAWYGESGEAVTRHKEARSDAVPALAAPPAPAAPAALAAPPAVAAVAALAAVDAMASPAALAALAALARPGAWLALLADVEARWPEEACGLVFDDAVEPRPNALGALHAADPGRFPRGPREGFRLGDRDALRLARALRSARPARALYHSHPDGAALPSREDVRAAFPAGGAAPAHPGLGHLIIGCRGGRAREARLFEARGGRLVEAARFALGG